VNLMAVWPILDQDRTRAELIAEALDLLPEVAEQTHCMVDGEPVWEVREGASVPGWGSVELVLVCTVPAREVKRTGLAGHIEMIRRLAGDGWTDRRIADRIGCSESGVQKIRSRAGVPPGVGNPTLAVAS
jgi:hypothetical protein